jgi:hypothetical protein
MRFSALGRDASFNETGSSVAVDSGSVPLRIDARAELSMTCVTSPVIATSVYDQLPPMARGRPWIRHRYMACETSLWTGR